MGWRIVSCIIGLTLCFPADAEEVEKKFRVGLSLGQFNTRETISSDAANQLYVVDENGLFKWAMEDPRNDNAALGSLKLRPGTRVMVTGQYAINRFFVVEGAVGYQQGDVGAVEMQAEFDGTVIEDPQVATNKYAVYSIPAGTMTQVPFQLTAIARFRPKARLNPYLGIGAGYTLVGFDPGASLSDLSVKMDAVEGQQMGIVPNGGGLSPAPVPLAKLSGSKVEADNAVEWHVVGGMEYSLKKKWSVYADLRYATATRSFSIGFNGSDSLGISVPNRLAELGSAYETKTYGPVYIKQGGLVDGGLLVHPDVFEGAPSSPGVCPIGDPQRAQCEFLLNGEMAAYNEKNKDVEGFVPVTPDGVLDPGMYYVKGGSIRYSGTSLQVGFRYTF
jgi:opacity protein-like surface antigen